MPKWTPEPWFSGPGYDRHPDDVRCIFGGPKGAVVLIGQVPINGRLSSATDLANLRRIIDCVNACAGLDPIPADLAAVVAEWEQLRIVAQKADVLSRQVDAAIQEGGL
jgi:hypothetical protein